MCLKNVELANIPTSEKSKALTVDMCLEPKIPNVDSGFLLLCLRDRPTYPRFAITTPYNSDNPYPSQKMIKFTVYPNNQCSYAPPISPINVGRAPS